LRPYLGEKTLSVTVAHLKYYGKKQSANLSSCWPEKERGGGSLLLHILRRRGVFTLRKKKIDLLEGKGEEKRAFRCPTEKELSFTGGRGGVLPLNSALPPGEEKEENKRKRSFLSSWRESPSLRNQ